jgi:hypothetical protein
MVCKFFRSVRVLADRQLAEVETIKRRFLEGRKDMEPASVEMLREQSFKAIRLEEGGMDWRTTGLTLEAGNRTTD